MTCSLGDSSMGYPCRLSHCRLRCAMRSNAWMAALRRMTRLLLFFLPARSKMMSPLTQSALAPFSTGHLGLIERA